MQKPFKYFVIDNKTGKTIGQSNTHPMLHELQTWEKTANEGVFELIQTKTAYIDTRYEAKLRLFNYVTYTRQGLEAPRYRPFAGTQIGVSVPILNF